MTRQEEVRLQAPPNGRRAVAGAVIAVLGVLAAANPGNAVLRVLHEVAPVLAETLPTMITACGAVLAAVSQPPRLRKSR